VYLRVVAEGADGATRALNHFNKRAKGLLTRALLERAEDFVTIDELVAWAETAGLRLRAGAEGELELVVPVAVAPGAARQRRTAPSASGAQRPFPMTTERVSPDGGSS